MPGSGESVAPRIQRSGDISTRVQNILPTSSVLPMNVPVHWASGLIPLGCLHLRPLHVTFSCSSRGLYNWFTSPRRSDDPCQPIPALAGHIFSQLWIPI